MRQQDGLEFYVGGYGVPGQRGIARWRFDPEEGAGALIDFSDELANPSWVLPHPERPLLYAVEERSPEGGLAALSEADGHLRKLVSLPTGGADPCHIALAPGGRHLLVANYTGGSLAVFALDGEGVPVERTDLVQHRMAAPTRGNPARQEAAHVHFSQCDGERVYVCDLGLDQVIMYGWDARRGRLDGVLGALEFPAGSGPRHLALAPDGASLYVLCELDATLHVFRRDAGGEWARVQTAAMVCEGDGDFGAFAWSAGAALRFAGRDMLCASVRGRDTLVSFRVEADGRLSRRRIVPSGGRTPRDFLVAGEWLFAANQDSDRLNVLRLRDGAWTDTGKFIPAVKPTCVATRGIV